MDARTMGSGTLTAEHRVGADAAAPGAVSLGGRPLPVVGTARVYVCGITPYDVTHLGHAATFVWADVLGIAFATTGARVETSRNVTDVDDVLLDAARARGRNYDQLALLAEAAFDRSMRELRVATPTHQPRSRHHVSSVVQLAAALLATGAAYERDGTVWFRGAAVAETAERAGLPRERALELSAAYGDEPVEPAKDDPFDVAVWRPSAEGLPAWPSPWGWGRPGWHAECAAMALAVHGAGVDVLLGGADLAFPHHAYQAAMVAAGSGVTPFARTTAHVGLVDVDGAKMAKSTGNLVLTDDVLTSRSPAALRLALVDRPWDQPWSWRPELLDAAEGRLEELYSAAGRPAGGGSGSAEAAGAAVRARLRDGLDVTGALDLAAATGGAVVRDALRLLRLG